MHMQTHPHRHTCVHPQTCTHPPMHMRTQTCTLAHICPHTCACAHTHDTEDPQQEDWDSGWPQPVGEVWEPGPAPPSVASLLPEPVLPSGTQTPGATCPEGAPAPTGCGWASQKPPPEQAAWVPRLPRLTEGCAGLGWAVSLGGAFGIRPRGGRQPCGVISSSLRSGIFRPFIFLRGHQRACCWRGRGARLLAPRTPLHPHMWL